MGPPPTGRPKVGQATAAWTRTGRTPERRTRRPRARASSCRTQPAPGCRTQLPTRRTPHGTVTDEVTGPRLAGRPRGHALHASRSARPLRGAGRRLAPPDAPRAGLAGRLHDRRRGHDRSRVRRHARRRLLDIVIALLRRRQRRRLVRRVRRRLLRLRQHRRPELRALRAAPGAAVHRAALRADGGRGRRRSRDRAHVAAEPGSRLLFVGRRAGVLRGPGPGLACPQPQGNADHHRRRAGVPRGRPGRLPGHADRRLLDLDERRQARRARRWYVDFFYGASDSGDVLAPLPRALRALVTFAV